MPFRSGRPFALMVAALAAPLTLGLAPPCLAQSPPPSPGPVLTLGEALARAAAADPAVGAGAARVAAADASIRQAGVRPNPSIGLDVENFAGSGPYSLVDRAETTLSWQQVFERGGKRDARTALARSEREVVLARLRTRRLDFLAEVQKAWVEALVAEATVQIARDRLTIAEQLEKEVARRVRAARDPLFAGARAEADVLRARAALDQARAAAHGARVSLAALWRGPPDFTLDLRAFDDLGAADRPAPSADTADLEVLAAEREVAAARIQVEQSRGVQDPTLNVGVRHFWEDQAVALVVGGSLPIGRYDTNRAAVERAEAERRAADLDLVAARLTREREIARLQGRLAAQAAEVAAIDIDIAPKAYEAVKLAREGYARGGFSYLDIASGQQALVEIFVRRAEVLKSFHLDKAALDRLTGAHARIASATEN